MGNEITKKRIEVMESLLNAYRCLAQDRECLILWMGNRPTDEMLKRATESGRRVAKLEYELHHVGHDHSNPEKCIPLHDSLEGGPVIGGQR